MAARYQKSLPAAALALAVLLPSTSQALELRDIAGRWNHRATGDNIRILRNKDVEDSALGQGRIQLGVVEHGANALIVYRGDTQCWYYITLSRRGRTLNLKPVHLEGSHGKCLRGAFDRAYR